MLSRIHYIIYIFKKYNLPIEIIRDIIYQIQQSEEYEIKKIIYSEIKLNPNLFNQLTTLYDYSSDYLLKMAENQESFQNQYFYKSIIQKSCNNLIKQFPNYIINEIRLKKYIIQIYIQLYKENYNEIAEYIVNINQQAYNDKYESQYYEYMMDQL